MKSRNKFIVKSSLGKAQREVCKILYSQDHQSVYDYADVTKMAYSSCSCCETETPTIITVDSDECALCGEEKQKQLKY
tara:strand:+ start:63359 stop:63592 length:234 start_codon:yes stop_codon:yes gene_type:complete